MAAFDRARVSSQEAVSVSSAPRLHAEIESPRPLRAVAGQVDIVGWCFAAGRSEPPAMRLNTAAGLILQRARETRTDVPLLFPDEPAAAMSGFRLAGSLPSGVYLAQLEAEVEPGRWRWVRSLTLAVESRPFAAEVETIASGAPLTERTHVSGWALHPSQPVTALSLRYGHQDLPCVLGLLREDVPRQFPDVPHAQETGFRSETILSAGVGPLRLRARLATGEIAVARTPVTIAVAHDENHGPGIDLRGERIPLPGYARRTPSPAAGPALPRLNVLFVLHGDFTANSSLQACALANGLAELGHDCTLAVPRDLETQRHQLEPRFRACLHAQAMAEGGGFADGRGPDVIHAWTTRERIREVATQIRARHGGRLVIQLEDNEHAILAHATGQPFAALAAMDDRELEPLLSPELAHPRRSQAFLASADAVTVIVDRLREFVPAGKPCTTVWPAADARYFFPRPPADAFHRLLDERQGAFVLFYHGNVHAANAREMRELYAAVARLNAEGEPVTLIRAGVDQVAFLEPALVARVAPHVLSLGQILNHRHLPPLMALADAFVQPGEPDAFNDYRFPSKLPEFFALGRPVILPRTNLGEHVRHGEDAYVLPKADEAGITEAVRALRRDPALAARLAAGAAAFSAAHFGWQRSAATLANAYAALTRS